VLGAARQHAEPGEHLHPARSRRQGPNAFGCGSPAFRLLVDPKVPPRPRSHGVSAEQDWLVGSDLLSVRVLALAPAEAPRDPRQVVVTILAACDWALPAHQSSSNTRSSDHLLRRDADPDDHLIVR
jgi:hypothetical protein